MNFASDNWAGAAKEIAASLQEHSDGFSPAYGASDLDQSLERRFNDLFEKEVGITQPLAYHILSLRYEFLFKRKVE